MTLLALQPYFIPQKREDPKTGKTEKLDQRHWLHKGEQRVSSPNRPTRSTAVTQTGSRTNSETGRRAKSEPKRETRRRRQQGEIRITLNKAREPKARSSRAGRGKQQRRPRYVPRKRATPVKQRQTWELGKGKERGGNEKRWRGVRARHEKRGKVNKRGDGNHRPRYRHSGSSAV